MSERNCGNCKYYAEYEGVCCCADSDEVADFIDREFCCKFHKWNIPTIPPLAKGGELKGGIAIHGTPKGIYDL